MKSTTRRCSFIGKVILSLAFALSLDSFVSANNDETVVKTSGPELFKIKVSAGKFDRKNTVVETPVWYEGIELSPVTLTDENGVKIPGLITNANYSEVYMQALKQATGDKKPLHNSRLKFVLPSLTAGKTVTLTATKSAWVKPPYQWHDDGSTESELQFNNKAVVKYMYAPIDDSTKERRAETYKVFHHVYSPDGSRLLTKGAGGKFPHHRGIFFGFNRITYGNGKKADTWHCKDKASQINKVIVNRSSAIQGHSMSVIEWNGEDGKPFAIENREVDVTKVDGATMIDFRTLLTTSVGKVKLDGDPQHAGVQFRASQEVPDHTAASTYYIRPDGKSKPGEFRNWSNKKDESDINKAHINLPWHAISFELPPKSGSGKKKSKSNSRYTVCYLDSADNPKPARFSERDYGRFGSYFATEIDTLKPLLLHYRYWIFDGELEVADIQKLSDQFANPVSVELLK